MTELWSWILTAFGIVGLYLAGSKNAYGWIIGLCAQILWLTYAIFTQQYGFIVSAFAYGFVYFRNFHKWTTVEDVEVKTHE